jgi:hypothetical protein
VVQKSEESAEEDGTARLVPQRPRNKSGAMTQKLPSTISHRPALSPLSLHRPPEDEGGERDEELQTVKIPTGSLEEEGTESGSL